MGFRFSRSVQLIPGIRLNVGSKSSSLSFGGRGAHYTIGAKGSRTTFGIPGSGLSWTNYTPHRSAPHVGIVVQQPRSFGAGRLALLLFLGAIVFGLAVVTSKPPAKSPEPESTRAAVKPATPDSQATITKHETAYSAIATAVAALPSVASPMPSIVPLPRPRPRNLGKTAGMPLKLN
jgi:hypothetical protein